jgi:hypothetical protein
MGFIGLTIVVDGIKCTLNIDCWNGTIIVVGAAEALQSNIEDRGKCRTPLLSYLVRLAVDNGNVGNFPGA